MKRISRKNVLNKIDDAINDKIDKIKEKKKEKKANKKSLFKKKKNKVYDYEKEADKVKRIDFDEESDYKYDETQENNFENIKSDIDDIRERSHEDLDETFEIKRDENSYDEIDIDEKRKSNQEEAKEEIKKEKKKWTLFKKKDKKNKKIKNEETDEEINEEEVNIKEMKKKKKVKGKHIKSEKPKKKKRSFWKKLVTFILILCILGVLAITAFLAYVALTAPEFNESALTIKDQTVIYDINGNIITTLGTEKRESVTYDALPQVLIDAIIATEDARFFQHNGVDLFRFIKATALQLMGKDEAGGASTLTMQTVKNNLTKKDTVERNDTLEGKVKRVIRKFQDVYLAVFKVEKEYSKERILEIYVNDNGLGSSYYGVEEASKYYFGKSVSDLTLPEAAMIAGLFQAPNRHNPYYDIESATKRRTTVLNLMQRHGYITKEEKELAEKIPIESILKKSNTEKTPYQGFVDTVVAEVERLTDTGDGNGDNPYTVPMKIYTTMERSIQDGVNAVLNDNGAWYWKDAEATAGIAVVNVETGAIAAVGGGRNKEGERLFNNATQAHRQPGSTAKPLFDYGPGIEYNNFSAYQLFNDEPWGYTGGKSINNWDGGFQGMLTMRNALARSRNIPALKAFQQVGAKNSQKFVSSLGLDVSLDASSENYHVFDNGYDNTINEAYAIGGAAEGYTPLEMASAYSAFASGGYYTKAYCVTKIIYRETGDEKEYKHTKERVMKDSTAYIINNILESAVSGLGFPGGAAVPGSHVAAKTGTSNFDENTMRAKGLPGNAVNDLWTVAYTSQYSVAVWYGYEKVTSTTYNISSGSYKEGVTAATMAFIPKDTQGWSMPSSVVVSAVEVGSWPAKLPSSYTPADLITQEYFVRGTQPTEVSERFQKLNAITNVTTNKTSNNTVTISWKHEEPVAMTDEYLNNYFNNSVYGNQKAGYLAARKSYINDTMGGLGFGIYKKNADGSLTSVGFVREKEYKYTGYGNTTLVIKAEYGSGGFKNMSSDGYEVSVSLDTLSPDKLNVTLKNNSDQCNAGTYQENGIEKVTYNGKDVTNDSNLTITYIVTTNSSSETFTTKADVENYMNTQTPGKYTITYKVKYINIESSKNRTITIR